MKLHMTWSAPRALQYCALLLLPACIDRLQDSNPVVRSKAVQSVHQVQAGETVDLAVQYFDKDGKPVDGIESVFLVSDSNALMFENESSVVDELRVKSTASKILGIEGHGIAEVRLIAGALPEQVDVTVWGGLASSSNVAADASSSAAQLWPFHVRVLASPETDGGSQ